MTNLPILHRKKKLIDWESFKFRPAADNDCHELITEPCKIYVDGMLGALYLDISSVDTRAMVEALKKVEIRTSERTSGMVSTSRTFGYVPRRPLGRGDFCSGSTLNREAPEVAQELAAFIKPLVALYEQCHPAMFKLHQELADKILPEWRIHGLYSSGIVNRDNQLPYHFDTGNIETCWSIMPVFKKDIEGGHLNLPQLDISLECRDHTCFMFDGQDFLHGVTPFKKLSASAYRFSCVYYTMKELWQCLPYDEELHRARVRRTETEERTAQGRLSESLEKQMAKHEKGQRK